MIKKYWELEKASWKIEILVIFVNKNVGHVYSVPGRVLKSWAHASVVLRGRYY